MTDPHRELWRAVIAQAFQDLMLPATLKDRAQLRARRKAIDWLTVKSDDLIEVCAHANLSPDATMRMARELLGGRMLYPVQEAA